MEFDGDRIDFDELVFCGQREAGTLTARPSMQSLPARSIVSRPTVDGGLLAFRLSWVVCSLGQSVWRAGVTPETEFRAPPEYLPPFLWVDAVVQHERTYGKEYLSESYFDALYARRRLLSPMRFSIPEHPPSEALIREALVQADREKARWVNDPAKAGYKDLRADAFMFALPEAEWRDVEGIRERVSPSIPAEPEKLVEYLDAFPRGAPVMLLKRDGAPDWLHASLSAALIPHRINLADLWEYGIPRRGAEVFGLLRYFGEEYVAWPDGVIPLLCRKDGVAFPDPERRGMLIWRREPCATGLTAKWLELDGQRIENPKIRVGYRYFSPVTRTLYFTQ